MVRKQVLIGCVIAALAGGCASGSSKLFPNTDKELRKDKKQLQTEAASQTYPADATRAGLSPVRASIEYGLDVINLVNLSEEPWDDAGLWVNQQFYVQIPHLPAKRQVSINFRMLYDNAGQPAPSKGVWIDKLELLRGGSLYDVTAHPAE